MVEHMIALAVIGGMAVIGAIASYIIGRITAPKNSFKEAPTQAIRCPHCSHDITEKVVPYQFIRHSLRVQCSECQTVMRWNLKEVIPLLDYHRAPVFRKPEDQETAA